ncbi:hypothetical protein ACFQPA_00240 [Halomarina halobia]|uniref:Uncharacterized protein n=1 Tax=Halomarina halobia TaxID=3033386 RepID=A0ABD6A7Z7_9EURY|nr:hypothetical protein [Halomarina sp. PSR21]
MSTISTGRGRVPQTVGALSLGSVLVAMGLTGIVEVASALFQLHAYLGLTGVLLDSVVPVAVVSVLALVAGWIVLGYGLVELLRMGTG